MHHTSQLCELLRLFNLTQKFFTFLPGMSPFWSFFIVNTLFFHIGIGNWNGKLKFYTPNHGQKQLKHSPKKIWFVKRVSFSITNFHISIPSLLFNVVTTWQCQRSVFKHWNGGEGVTLSTKKMFFWIYVRRRLESVFFAQMYQHFCLWLTHFPHSAFPHSSFPAPRTPHCVLG